MDKQLQTELTKIIANINSGTESVWGFISEQTPAVVQQLLMWHGVSSGILFLFGILILIVTTIVLILFAKKCSSVLEKKSDSYLSDLWLAGYVFIPIVGYGIGLCFLKNFAWLKIWIAPKVWLLEYFG